MIDTTEETKISAPEKNIPVEQPARPGQLFLVRKMPKLPVE